MALTAARPKSRRPLQHPNPTRQNGFVAAVPSRAFRDGTGIFAVKLSHYQIIASLDKQAAVVPMLPQRIQPLFRFHIEDN